MLFPVDALTVALAEHGQLATFGELQGVHEAETFEGFVLSGHFQIGVLNIQGRDVVRHEHDLVGEELAAVHAGKVAAGHAAHEVDDEISGSGAGVEDLDFGRGEQEAELVTESGFDGFAHVLDDGGRGVDDAVGVGGFDGVATEEALVDVVEKFLFGGEVGDVAGGAFDGGVERVEGAEIVIAAEAVADESVDDTLDFKGDSVAAGELGVVEDGAEEAFGEEVLDEHLIDGFAADVGVEGELAKGKEGGEGRLEVFVRLVGSGDFFSKAAGELGDALGEFLDGVVEFLNVGLGETIKTRKESGKLAGIGEIAGEDAVAVLIEDGALGVLKDGVVKGVAAADFLFDFAVEIVVGVLRFPVAARDGEGIAEGSVETDRVAAGRGGGPFGDECPVVEAGGIGEKDLKGVAEAAFVFYILSSDLGKGLVIGANEAVIRWNFDRAGCHSGMSLA